MNHTELLQFLSNSPTSFHAVASTKEILKAHGYQELKENEMWNLAEGGMYFATRNDSSIIAFRYPKKDFHGFMVGASHSDSPTYKIKANPEIKTPGYVKLNVEMYGGALSYTWVDRPLSVAGRLVVQENGKLVTKLLKIERDLLLIPSLAIHMDRNANKDKSWNVQIDMCPLFSEKADDTLLDIVAREVGIAKEDILGQDLYLYNRQAGSVWGANQEYISAGHLDDLQCGFGNLYGLLESEGGDSVAMLAIFDNEEVGSLSQQGADSTFLSDTVQRILDLSGKDGQEKLIAIRNSFMVSADNAHAIHPNHLEVADPTNRPLMNRGIVIKCNASQKYTSDGVSSAYFKQICKEANVPYQEFANKSDMVGGSTLGNLSNRHLSLNQVDIGLPQLSMHSSYETAGTKDTQYLVDAMKVFYTKSFAM